MDRNDDDCPAASDERVASGVMLQEKKKISSPSLPLITVPHTIRPSLLHSKIFSPVRELVHAGRAGRIRQRVSVCSLHGPCV